MKSEPLYYSIKDVANWDINDNATVVIPRLQRGLVWDAVKTEVLWDSLFRGIPIGTFVLCSQRGLRNQTKKEDTYNPNGLFLLDGQQRANAIAMGFKRFPPPISQESQPILWLDLSPNTPISGARREFWFKVTTQAHPWGYKSTKDENETAARDYCTEYDAGAMCIDLEAISRYQRCWLDHEKEHALHFVQTTKARFLAVYRRWYETLEVDEWFTKGNPILALRSKLKEDHAVCWQAALRDAPPQAAPSPCRHSACAQILGVAKRARWPGCIPLLI